MTWQKYLVKIDIYLHYPVLFVFVTLQKRYFYSPHLDLHIQINLKGKIKYYLKLSYNWLSWNKVNSFSSYMEGFTGVYSLEHQNTGMYSLEHWNTVLYYNLLAMVVPRVDNAIYCLKLYLVDTPEPFF